jgi:hypothetical protein
MCFLKQFLGSNERLVRKPFLILKSKHSIACVKNFLDTTALDLKLGYNTIRLDQDTIQNLYHHPFLGSDLPQELTMETAGSPDITIVKANGFPRG